MLEYFLTQGLEVGGSGMNANMAYILHVILPRNTFSDPLYGRHRAVWPSLQYPETLHESHVLVAQHNYPQTL